jgi:hypothetical protein
VASPFSLLRRNQKIMLAVLTLMAMVAFVFLDPVMRYLSRGRGQGENPIVVETNFGDFRSHDLQNLVYQRQLVEQFIARVIEQSIAKQFGQANIDQRWLSGAAQQQFLFWRQQVMGRSVLGPEEAAIETMVMADRARQMGLVVSDETVADTIKQISGGTITSQELQQIIGSLQQGRAMSASKLFDSLRTELLASKYRQFFEQSLADIPPAQRFEYFSRLNRRAKAEVLPLAVADFVSQVPDPTDAEVKELYEKYKNTLPDPTSPEPGFKEPKRATFQYVMASLEPLTEKMKAEVTEDEIAKYYEENRRNFPALGVGGPDDKPAGQQAEEKSAEEKPTDQPAEEKPAEEKPEEEKPAETPAAEEPKAEEQPAEAEPSTEPAPENKPAEEAPSEEKPSDEAPAESPQAGVRAQGSRFRLVSATLQEEQPAAESSDGEAGPALGNPAEEKPAEDPAPAADAPAEEKPAAETPAEEIPAEDKPADPKDQVVPEPTVPEPQFEPLEKVRDEIRDILARRKALERLDTQFEELSTKMRKYVDQHDIYITSKQTNANAKPPAPLDFAKLVEGTDLTAGELKSVTALEAARQPLGKSQRATANGGTSPFPEFAFSDSFTELRPEFTQDAENNFFLFWKVDEEPSFTPPLDQVRDKVVLAWKMLKARELAKKRADEYAAQARSQNKPLAELFGSLPNTKVVETPAFSWLTFGNVPAGPGAVPRLSEIEGLDQVGNEFMQTVFSLAAGQVGTAFNVPQDTVFVIQVKEFEPSEEQLRTEFAREDPNRYLGAAREERFEMYRDWIAELNKQANVQWLRQADIRMASEGDESEL